jgi:WD40 repeat protein
MEAILAVLLIAIVVAFAVLVIKRFRPPSIPPAAVDPPADSPPAADSVPEKKSRDPKPRKPPIPSARPLTTADLVFNIGSTQPITFAIDPRGQFMFVACRNRQQLLFSIENFDTPNYGRVLQRYKITDDTISDCTFVRNSSGGSEIVAGLDRGHSVRSFVIDPSSAKSAPGSFQADNVCKFQIAQVRVAPDNSFVCVLGDDTYIRVFHPSGNQLFAKDTAQMHNSEIAVSSNSELLVASSYTSDVVVYGVERNRAEVPVKVVRACAIGNHTNSVETVDFDRKTMIVATGGKDCRFNVFQAPLRWREGEDARLRWSGTTPAPVLKVRIAPGGSTIAILLADGSLAFHQQGTPVKTIACVHNAITKGEDAIIEWHPNGKWIFVGALASPFIYGYAIPV